MSAQRRPSYRCVVHGTIDDDARSRVVDGLVAIEGERFGVAADDVSVTFIEVAKGTWFTGGKPSNASFVQGTVPPGTSQDVRAAHMADVCQAFSSATGSPYDDVMVVAADGPS
ncbi:MAG: tautomerase family protein [Acidimicrobiales bacterium]